MNLFGGVLITLLIGVSVVHAQITEQWRAWLTNNVVAPLQFEDALVDSLGNTVVAGNLGDYNAPNPSLGIFLVKFDRYGNRQWLIDEALENTGILSSLSIDAEGNIFVSTVLDPRTLASGALLLKFDSDGKELWRIYQNDVVNLPSGCPIRTDRHGNVYWATLLVRYPSSSQFMTEWQVAKFNSDGLTNWKSFLPGVGYLLSPSSRPSSMLAMSGDGGLLMTGSYSGQVFPTSEAMAENLGWVAKISNTGELEWWTTDAKGRSKPFFYESVASGAKETVCAAGSGISIYSRKGKASHFLPRPGRIMGVGADGDYLLINYSFLFEIGPNGKENWGVQPLNDVFHAIPDGNGWLVVGSEGYVGQQMQFARVNWNGQREWVAPVAQNPFGPMVFRFSDKDRPLLLRAPDGTVRLVGQVPSSVRFDPGILVMSFGSQ